MRKKNLYPFLVSLMLLLAVIIINRLSFNSMREYTDAVDRSREIITSYEELSADLKSAEIYSETILGG
jgi:CHASE3 domain sensor protein